MKMTKWLSIAAGAIALSFGVAGQADQPYMCLPSDIDGRLAKPAKSALRFASFNAYLNRNSQGQLIQDLQDTEQPQQPSQSR